MNIKIILFLSAILFSSFAIAQKNNVDLNIGYALATNDFINANEDINDDGLKELNAVGGFSVALSYKRNLWKGIGIGIKGAYNHQPLDKDVTESSVSLIGQSTQINNANYGSALLLGGLFIDIPLKGKFKLKANALGGYHSITLSEIKFDNPIYSTSYTSANATTFATDFGAGIGFTIYQNMEIQFLANYTSSQATLPERVINFDGGTGNLDVLEVKYAILSLSVGYAICF